MEIKRSISLETRTETRIDRFGPNSNSVFFLYSLNRGTFGTCVDHFFLARNTSERMVSERSAAPRRPSPSSMPTPTNFSALHFLVDAELVDERDAGDGRHGGHLQPIGDHVRDQVLHVPTALVAAGASQRRRRGLGRSRRQHERYLGRHRLLALGHAALASMVAVAQYPAQVYILAAGYRVSGSSTTPSWSPTHRR